MVSEIVRNRLATVNMCFSNEVHRKQITFIERKKAKNYSFISFSSPCKALQVLSNQKCLKEKVLGRIQTYGSCWFAFLAQLLMLRWHESFWLFRHFLQFQTFSFFQNLFTPSFLELCTSSKFLNFFHSKNHGFWFLFRTLFCYYWSSY